MNVFLMYPDRDFDNDQEIPWNAQSLTEDLELETLFSAMTGEDKFIYDVVKTALFTSLNNRIDTILFRQETLRDCLANPAQIKDLYSLARQAIDFEKTTYFGLFRSPSSVLNRSLEVMKKFTEIFRKISNIARENNHLFTSPGFNRFFTMIKQELSDEYLFEIENHLKGLQFRKGVLISAELGVGNKGEKYLLHKSRENKQSLWESIFSFRLEKYMITIADRDDRGYRALSEIRDRGLNEVANSLAQSVDHILSFFSLLRTELAFYIGCLNLFEAITIKQELVSFPKPCETDVHSLNFSGLYDICLLLNTIEKVIGNDLEADGKDLFIITGANQGGKSTFLRSLGVSQLMMQSGMFVPGLSYSSSIYESLFTHFRREEDETMKSGKLDEELSRMSHIVDSISSRSMILFNESFAATNEREGSEIARQIILALVEKGIKVFFVTHLSDFAQSIFKRKIPNSMFLRAERQADGLRTFKISLGEPLDTSYGEDIYYSVFKHESSSANPTIEEGNYGPGTI